MISTVFTRFLTMFSGWTSPQPRNAAHSTVCLQVAPPPKRKANGGDADLIGEVADLRLAVARDKHDPVEVVPPAEVADERRPVGPRPVAEAER